MPLPRIRASRWSGGALLLLAGGCSKPDTSPRPEPPPAPTAHASAGAMARPSPSSSAVAGLAFENDASLHPALLALAQHSSLFPDAKGLWWAPTGCAPPPSDPTFLSKTDEATPHGRKLFTLRILDFAAYARDTGAPAAARGSDPRPGIAGVPALGAVEQAVVKLSYRPTEDQRTSTRHPSIGGSFEPAEAQGKKYWPGEPGPLFVMYRPRAPARATDDGWLYGTVSPDEKTVTAAGLLESCMNCHRRAPHGRLFGLPRT